MKTEHTPGPWKFDDVWHLITGPNGEEVAAVHSGQADDTARRQNRNAVYANAQLIAAAPELLNALDECQACLVALQKTVVGQKDWPNHATAVIHSAAALIDRATR